MQNKFFNFIKAKGYYIVLLICAVAVGVTGYFLLTAEEAPEAKVQAVANVTEAPKTSESEQKETSAQAIEPTTAAPNKPFRLQRPLAGEAVTAFAADHLAYNATTKDWRTHEGLDLAAVIGQEVSAAADGTVHTVYDDENYGMTVVLHHTDGFSTHYSNLSEELQVEVGQAVTAGSILGTVGNTANAETATQPHLHFALYQNNSPVDPGDYFE